MRNLLLMLFVGVTLASPSAACTGAEECPLGDRGYHVREPEGWDGTSPLPVMLHFHGWGRQGETIMGHARIAGATVPRGVLLVAPDGLGRTWDFRRAGSRDTPFARNVLADVASRYPIEGQPLIVSGYSWGALMAARFACESGLEIEALLLVSGAFPPSIECNERPLRISQVYGLEDQVLDFPYGPNNDETYAVELWRDRLACGTKAGSFEWEAVSWLTHTRHEWVCERGVVTMDVHGASHLIPRGWFAQLLDEVLPGQE